MEKEFLTIYLNAELSCRHITNIRIALREKHPKTIENRWILDWPRSQEQFIPLDGFHILVTKQMEFLDNRSNVEFYLVSKAIFDKIQKSSYSFNYKKFNLYRDYFAIQRLRYLAKNYQSEVKFTIEYRPSETNIPEWPLTTTNSDLLSFLESKEDVNGKFEVNRLRFRCKIRSHLFPLVFQELLLFRDKQIFLETRKSREKSIKPRGYILLKDKQKFLNIARVTEENMLKLIVDEELLQKIHLTNEKFEKRKIGA